MLPASGLGVILIAVLGVLGVAATVWVFWPAFRGPEAARKAIGTHRLAVGSLLAFVVFSVAITAPMASYLHLEQGLNAATFVVAALLTQIPMLLVVYLRLILPGAVTWRELGLRPVPVGYWLRMGVGAGLVGVVAIEAVGILLSQVGLQPNQLEQFEFVRSEGPLQFGLLLISAAVVAPFVEELFFRGFLFGLYRRRQPLWVAYGVPSLLFTLLHNDPSHMTVPQMVGLSVGIFMLAMLLTWLYQHTGSLYPGMLAHGLNNATGLILVYTGAGLQ
ncbi:MAG TPA: CPBP family intramembrane glutamic endopeptidase [Chloroflexota bacterium]|nr:CPBP family intramembrane glutamic endopeptidase [Chloroflexota bacterium]